MAEITNFDLFKGTSPVLRIKLTVAESVLGWTTKFFMRDRPGGNTVYEQDGVLSSQVANAVNIGIWEVAIPKANLQALTTKTFAWSFERTNSGAEDVLALGNLTLKLK